MVKFLKLLGEYSHQRTAPPPRRERDITSSVGGTPRLGLRLSTLGLNSAYHQTLRKVGPAQEKQQNILCTFDRDGN
jgi:hypothetical protein